MKKTFLVMGFILLLLLHFASVGYARYIIETDDIDIGIITVQSTEEITKKIKVKVEKENKDIYYDLTEGKEKVPFALTMGNGTYKVRVFENVSGTSYVEKVSKTVKLNMSNNSKIYLNSTQEVNWNENQKYIALARELTSNLETDEEKISTIYKYLTSNFTYNYTKIYRISSTYKPDLDTLYDEKTGICYDYSAIFAGMLRSIGIPTKLVKGYITSDLSTYHAWNEVLVNGEWKTVDTTNDSYKISKGIETNMFKDSANFIVNCEY